MLNKDEDYAKISKKEKKTLNKKLILYVKAKQQPYHNITQVALIWLNKSKVLLIKIDFYCYIILGVIKDFFVS